MRQARIEFDVVVDSLTSDNYEFVAESPRQPPDENLDDWLADLHEQSVVLPVSMDARGWFHQPYRNTPRVEAASLHRR